MHDPERDAARDGREPGPREREERLNHDDDRREVAESEAQELLAARLGFGGGRQARRDGEVALEARVELQLARQLAHRQHVGYRLALVAHPLEDLGVDQDGLAARRADGQGVGAVTRYVDLLQKEHRPARGQIAGDEIEREQAFLARPRARGALRRLVDRDARARDEAVLEGDRLVAVLEAAKGGRAPSHAKAVEQPREREQAIKDDPEDAHAICSRCIAAPCAPPADANDAWTRLAASRTAASDRTRSTAAASDFGDRRP